MKLQLLLLIYGCAALTTTLDVNTAKCTCIQILNETQCRDNKECQWDQGKCGVLVISTQSFCDLVEVDKCNKTSGCALLNEKCVSFSGCTVYSYTTNDQCQNISQECTSDGEKCIGLDECITYKNSISCYKDQNGKLCYWSENACSLPKTCDQLPNSLKSDNECRLQLSTCTMKENGGCEISGNDCAQQKLEGSCKTNLLQTIQCIWDNGICKDKICLNSPITNTSHDLCQKYLNICTVNDTDNGCQNIPNICTNLKTQNNCIINNNNQLCYWNKNTQKCEDKNCDNATDDYQNNDKCLTWLDTCTVKDTGIGCQIRQNDCTKYTVELSCHKTLNNGLCFWNGTKCVSKTCDNALDTNINHDMCQLYLNTCTIQQDLTGCIQKETSCDKYKILEQCQSLLDGTLCTFQNNECIEAICSNAIDEITTDQGCKRFSPNCMLQQDQTGCILQECQNIGLKDSCITDYKGQKCYYGQQCQLRSCQNASDTLITDEQCREYLSICTVDDDLKGCKERPNLCAQLNYQQCKPLNDGTKCSWNDDDSNNSICRLLNCADVPPDTQTDDKCKSFDISCTVAENPSLCMTRPSSCDVMLVKEHCLAVVLDDMTTKCSWDSENSICRIRLCTDADITQYKSENDCRNYMSTCTYQGNGCVDEPIQCEGYKSQEICIVLTKTNTLCGWNGCETRTCFNAPKLMEGYYTHQTCNQYLDTCTVNEDQTGCVISFTLCSLIINQTQCNDTILQNGKHCYYDVSIEPFVCREFKCTDKQDSNQTHSSCQLLSNLCTLGESGIGCVDQKSSCNQITDQIQCIDTIITNTNKCGWDTSVDPPVCKDRTCDLSAIKSNIECEKYLNTCTFGSTTTGCITKPTACNGLNQDQCNNVKLQDGTYCSFDQTIETATLQCHARKCIDAPSDIYKADSLCRSWLPKCTVNSSETGCVDEPSDCTSMSKSQCSLISSTSTLCFWNSNANPASCRNALCTDASKTKYITDALCKTYISTCTVAKTGGCITQPTSCASLDQDHCPKVTINATDKINSENKCSWNSATNACQDRVCIDAPSTFTKESDCRSWLSTCTINLTNNGCMIEQAQCNLVQTQNQCQILSQNKKCGWNVGCVGRTCSNAPETYITDEQCRTYLSTCTVQIDGTGCVVRPDTCALIVNEKQCIKIDDTKKCQWNTIKTKCEDRSCTNALQTLTSHDMCNTYLSTCTVKASGQGCTIKLDKCSSYTSIGQCKETSTNTQCQWINNLGTQQCVDVLQSCTTYQLESQCTFQSDTSKCIWKNNSCYNRECTDAPKSYTTHAQCQEYGNNCTTNGKGCYSIQKCSQYQYATSCIQGTDGLCTLIDKCQIQTCDLAPITYKTDLECSTFLAKCTTNGNGCIEKKRCVDAYLEEACKYDNNNQQCEWINNQCLNKSCETASLDIKSEKDCESYFPNNKCTTKKGGGCTLKKKCKDAQIESACTTQYDDQKCSWQDGTCKLKSCTDLNGYDHKTCNSQQNNCTTDGYKCITMKTCSNTLIQQACIQGTDGPCLWSQGVCYKYTRCTDLIFKTHQECNSIHSQCTTNGLNCIPITKCSSTPKMGCYQGINGTTSTKCIWTPKNTKQSAQQHCIEFTDCKDALYLNHDDCYAYSLGQCTSDGKLGCVTLDTCDQYLTSISCQVDKNGIKLKNNLIIQTGKCTWSNDKCIQQPCSQLSGLNHQDCYDQLSTCTYNGIKCTLQSTCNTYTQAQCNYATGTDGKCIYQDDQCIPMKCENYPVTLCQMYSSTCIQDGSSCVSLKECSNYKTQTACDYGSNTSTICAWIVTSTNNKGKCVEVTTCTVASAYQKACQKLSDFCYWQGITVANVTEHICASKTCDIQNDGTCTGFYDWKKTKYTICQYNTSGKCVETDPTTLQSNQCSTQTLYQYTWNSISNKCQACQNTNTTPNKTDNGTNTTEIDDSSFRIIVSIMIFIIIL